MMSPASFAHLHWKLPGSRQPSLRHLATSVCPRLLGDKFMATQPGLRPLSCLMDYLWTRFHHLHHFHHRQQLRDYGQCAPVIAGGVVVIGRQLRARKYKGGHQGDSVSDGWRRKSPWTETDLSLACGLIMTVPSKSVEHGWMFSEKRECSLPPPTTTTTAHRLLFPGGDTN